MPNVFDQPPMEDLTNVVSFEGFDYEQYLDGELAILQPQLVALGYTDIQWRMGDHDSFGPLTRVCTARNAAGELKEFLYG